MDTDRIYLSSEFADSFVHDSLSIFFYFNYSDILWTQKQCIQIHCGLIVSSCLKENTPNIERPDKDCCIQYVFFHGT